MTRRFPDLPNYQGFKSPGRFEADIYDMEIDGDLPPGLSGTYYRVGPDPQFPPRLGTDIFFNGDGMVSMFRFDDGHVDYRQRYVRTEKFERERAARRALFGAYRNPFTDDPSVAGLIRGTANTNVVYHGGKFLALKEDSPPVSMDPDTLETEGSWDFHGDLSSKTFTAHPKVDPVSGEMVCFGFAAKGETTPDIAYYVVDAAGKVVHEVWIEAPYSGMVHDFAVTQDYVAFPIVPITSNLEWLKRGESHYKWDPGREVFIGVLPRRGEASDLRWFRGPCRYMTHIFNAFNEGNRVFIDAPVALGNPFPFFPDVTGAPFNLMRSAPHVTRWTVDLGRDGDAFEQDQFCDAICEFPRVDDRRAALPHRHGYMSVFDYTKPWDLTKAPARPDMYFNTIGHFDFATHELTGWFVGDTGDLEEVEFVQRSPEAPEGDGYLFALVNRHDEHRTDLVILDTARISEGPVATARLPFRLRSGLHGRWVPGWQLPPAPIAR